MSEYKVEYIYVDMCKQCNTPVKFVDKSTCQNPKCGEIERVIVGEDVKYLNQKEDGK